jgi:perosamine synthetase
MLGITKEIILTAGSSITHKELQYIVDASLDRWNHYPNDYIKKLEEAFAAYVGVEYAMSTSGCPEAVYLSALLALGVGEGDEVIIPDVTYIAVVNAVKYLDATPVFADIEPDTWVMDPKSVKKLITSQTKVIIPMHLYGHPVDMEPLWALAEKYGISIFEDAALSIGAEYKGKKIGSLGRLAAFSFHGAETLVTGEGGILVTNDKDLIDRVKFSGDYGRETNRALYNIGIGYKNKISNLQAAVGLAQIERVEEIVEKKRQVFRWYQERLEGAGDIALNAERPWARNVYGMISLVLGDSVNISRDEFMKKLIERNIDSRPFFYPISSFQMFRGVVVNNPVAYKVSLRGINLPGNSELVEEEVDYICAHILDILSYTSKKVTKTQPTGWLAYRDSICKVLSEYKKPAREGLDYCCLPISANNEQVGRLRPATTSSLNNESEINLLVNWRISLQEWFPSQFKVTFDGTKKWLDEQVIQKNERILFFVETNEGFPIGYAGLLGFNYKKRFCELEGIIRGVANMEPGIMTHACNTLLKWAFEVLGVESIGLVSFSDNEKALNLYQRLGFREMQRIPLMKVVVGEGVSRWVAVMGQPYDKAERYYMSMKLSKETWIQKY